jgi:lipoprotein-anchoring transpeptidase ErfK/SrfK
MLRKRNHRFSASVNRSNGTYWILALLLIVIVAWLWWKSGKTSPNKPTSRSKLTPSELSPTRRVATTPTNSPKPSLITSASAQPGRLPNVPQTNSTEPQVSAFPRTVQNVFEGQLALVQQGISSGSLDGVMGSQTRAAFMAFQQKTGLPATGELDATTRTNLLLTTPPYTNYTVTSNDLARLQPVAANWLGKSQQSALDYETIAELVAEKSFSSPNLVCRLNPQLDWTNMIAGTVVQVPNAFYPEVQARAAFVKIHLSGKTLEAFDAGTNLLAHFPCSIARRVEKRPVGELHVAVVAPNPNYTFDPSVFPESPEAQKLGRKLILPPGPNNPVGVAWIGLDKSGYGIHGTPKPEEVGRTESHGCFRLANWNAEYLLHLVTVGTPVYVVE